jgi:hypothetical protein
MTWGKLSESEAQRVTRADQERVLTTPEKAQRGSEVWKRVLGRGGQVLK